jgi:hypothetical protein
MQNENNRKENFEEYIVGLKQLEKSGIVEGYECINSNLIYKMF